MQVCHENENVVGMYRSCDVEYSLGHINIYNKNILCSQNVYFINSPLKEEGFDDVSCLRYQFSSLLEDGLYIIIRLLVPSTG